MDFEAVADGKPPKPEENQAVTFVQAMDLAAVQINLRTAYKEEINALVTMAEAHEVADEESEKRAIEIAAQAKTFLKQMDEERKRLIKEPGEFVTGVNKLVKVFRDMIVKVETGLKRKVGDFQWKKELERRKREKEAQEAAAKLQKKIEKEAKKAGVEAPVIAPVPVEKKETVTRTDTGASAHIRTEWKCTKIEDFAKVPDEYKALNEQKVKATIKAGVRNIPGLKIEEVPVTVLRA